MNNFNIFYVNNGTYFSASFQISLFVFVHIYINIIQNTKYKNMNIEIVHFRNVLCLKENNDCDYFLIFR